MGEIFRKHWAGNNAQVMVFDQGEILLVKYIVGYVESGVAIVEEKEGSYTKLTFLKNVVLVAEGYENRMGMQMCKHLRFTREAVKKSLNWVKENPNCWFDPAECYLADVHPWPRMRKALKNLGVPTIHIPGGFELVVAYDDEVAVPDYSMSGSHGWIIPKREIPRILNSLRRAES